MGEIKSTLDLIMEKTRNLSMSPEEKEEIRRQEWLKKARGWIQRFLDDLIDLDKVKSELLEKEHPPGWENILKKELIDGLEPEADNEKRFQLIEALLRIHPDGFRKIREGYHQRLSLERDKGLAVIKSRLADQGYSGTAIIPNLDRDPSWKTLVDREKKDAKKKWQALIDS